MPLLSAPVRPLPGAVRSALRSPLLAGLAAPHGIDRYLSALHPLWTTEGGRAQVVAVQQETADTTTFTLQPDHRWRGVRAGQHVQLGVAIDGVTRTRTYSVSSSAHRADGRFQITVKREPDGLVSGHLHRRAGPGTVLACSEARGEVVLPDPRPERALLLSAGSGITPVAAMLRTLVDEGYDGRVTFVHYARRRDDVPFLAELEHTAQRWAPLELHVVTTSDPGRDVPPGRAPRGRFAAHHLDALVPDHREGIWTVACGPSGMLDAVEGAYAAAGVADHLQVERFTAPRLRPAPGASGATVRFTGAGIAVRDDGRPLLEQAEAAGLSPVSGCRMGICHTCTRRKPEGAVSDLRDGRITDGPDAEIQICVTVPAGDVDIDL